MECGICGCGGLTTSPLCVVHQWTSSLLRTQTQEEEEKVMYSLPVSVLLHPCSLCSRYIQEVMQMYDDVSSTDSFSDSSVDDSPDSNNLFERL